MSLIDRTRSLPSFWTIQLTGWVVYFVVIYVTFLTIAPPENFVSLLILKGFRSITGLFLTSLLLRPIYKYFENRLSIGWLTVLVLVCAVIFGTAWTAIEGVFVYFTNTAFNAPNYLARGPRIALDYAMTLTAWSSLYLGVKNWLAWQKESENALQSLALANKAQLDMLRYQLNPHFLFNALNSIRASIDEDKSRAKQMITQLAEFLRYSLLNESAKKIPLHDELEAVRNYLAIEKIRFESKLEVDFDIQPAAEDFEVPCFLLNPLVENAIKHGLRSGPQPLVVRIGARLENGKFSLEVANSGSLKEDLNSNGTKIGLKNVRQRLEALFPKTSSFELSEKDGFVLARIEIEA